MKGEKTKQLWANPEYRLKMSNLFKTTNGKSSATLNNLRKMAIERTGSKRSKEDCESISKGQIGKKVSEETKLKMSLMRKGVKKAPWTLERKLRFSELRKGQNNIWWKGGLTELRKQIKNTLQYKHWRKSVFERDSYTCQFCEVKGGHLHCDHITPYAQIIVRFKILKLEDALACPDLWDTNNGRTLCRLCHKKTPTYGRPVTYTS